MRIKQATSYVRDLARPSATCNKQRRQRRPRASMAATAAAIVSLDFYSANLNFLWKKGRKEGEERKNGKARHRHNLTLPGNQYLS